MTIPASLSKLKSLFPVIVVGASVAITIKLLTESTPLTSEILQVKAEEDIFSPEYTEELVEPKEPEPQEPPKEEQSPPAEEQKDTSEETTQESPPETKDEQDRSADQKEDKEKPDSSEKKDEKKPSGGRMFGSSPIAKMLKNIFGGGKK